MKKICFVTNNIADIGGRQRINAVLANALANTNDIDVSILFTSPKEKAFYFAYPIDNKIHFYWEKAITRGHLDNLLYKVFRFINKRIIQIKNVPFLRRIYFPKTEIEAYQNFFDKYTFDTIIGVGTRPSAMIGLLKTNAKTIGWMHNSYLVYFERKNYFQWRQDALYRSILPNLNAIVVLTDKDVALYEDKINIKPIRIYNPLTFKSKGKSNLSSNKLLFVGRLDFYLKGLDLLINIINKVKEQLPDVEVTIVGDGEGRGRFEEAIKNNNLEKAFKIIGFSDNVSKYYLESSLVLLTSRQEGFGLVVIEAMECGDPVISFKTEGPSEIIRDSIDGFLIDNYDTTEFAEKIIYICKNGNIRKEMGMNASARAKDFSCETILQQWLKLI